MRDRRFALLEGVVGNELVAAHRLAREPQEHFAVGAERFAGERVERASQPRLGLFERRQPLAFRAGLRVATNALTLQRDFQRLLFSVRAHRGEEETERSPEYERNDGEEDGRRAQLRSR